MGAPGRLPVGDRSRDFRAELAGVAGGVDHDAVVVEELRDPESDRRADAHEGDGRAGVDVCARRLHDDERGAEQHGPDPAEGELPDLEDDGDQRGNQLDHEEEGAGDGPSDPGEECRDGNAEGSQSASRLERSSPKPDAETLFGPHRAPGLRAAAT
jgi:hypothetical protein